MMSDLINRQDAIYALTEANLKSHMDSVEGGQENRSAIRIIMELPSAERNRGEWSLNIDDWFGDCYKCSACGEEFILNEGNPKDNGYNYCPNCGAMMSESLKVHEIGKSLVDGIQAGIKGEKDDKGND